MVSNPPKPRALAAKETEIHDLADLEFSQAKTWWTHFLRLQVAVGAVSIVSLTSINPLVVAPCTIAALIFQVLAWFCQWKSATTKAQANRAHRMLHILYGLNSGITQDDLIELREQFSSQKVFPKRKYTPYYFYCLEAPSHVALLRCLQETGFYLCKLYAACASTFFWVIAISILTLLLSLITVAFLSQADPSLPVTVGKIVVVILTTLVATDLLGIAIAYLSASHRLYDLDTKLDRFCNDIKFDADGNSQSDVPRIMYIIIEFHAVTEQAPLIFNFLHQKKRLRLTKAWQDRFHHQHPITRTTI
jgi:hypothetical protein